MDRENMTTEQSALPQVTEAELAEAIEAATAEVFGTMLNLECKPGKPFVETQEATPASGVVSLIGLAGSWIGTGSVSCSVPGACRMASALLSTEYSGISEDVLDAIAEITNMIVGNVKTSLESRLGGMGLSTPTVIYGRNFQTRGARNKEWTVVPFEFDGDCMFVQVCISPNPDSNATAARPGYPIPHMLII